MPCISARRLRQVVTDARASSLDLTSIFAERLPSSFRSRYSERLICPKAVLLLGELSLVSRSSLIPVVPISGEPRPREAVPRADNLVAPWCDFLPGPWISCYACSFLPRVDLETVNGRAKFSSRPAPIRRSWYPLCMPWSFLRICSSNLEGLSSKLLLVVLMYEGRAPTVTRRLTPDVSGLCEC